MLLCVLLPTRPGSVNDLILLNIKSDFKRFIQSKVSCGSKLETLLYYNFFKILASARLSQVFKIIPFHHVVN